ncbi:MAG: chemotaxis protein CheV [Gammaproteobacteria bacterium]|nr:chemotaxis protein CheV [Gammaproteobacteria bacterium]
MSSFIQSVDERTQLAGTNKLEVLLFSLGKDTESDRDEIFGINVFKVREVMHAPEITKAPDMPKAVEGMVSLRGTMVPVINLQKFCGVKSENVPKILMITEYNKHVQGFLVDSVDMIKRLSWEEVKAPPQLLSSRLGGLVTAVSELDNNRLVMIMDVEKVLAESANFYEDETIFDGIDIDENLSATVLFADDSSVARHQISRTLEHMGLKSISAINGAEAWTLLTNIADKCDELNRDITEELNIILTDVEMPEMDGYVLTQKIKADPRFRNIPVVMHSSLTADANKSLGTGVGADAYVPKFEPRELAKTLKKLIG